MSQEARLCLSPVELLEGAAAGQVAGGSACSQAGPYVNPVPLRDKTPGNNTPEHSVYLGISTSFFLNEYSQLQYNAVQYSAV